LAEAKRVQRQRDFGGTRVSTPSCTCAALWSEHPVGKVVVNSADARTLCRVATSKQLCYLQKTIEKASVDYHKQREVPCVTYKG